MSDDDKAGIRSTLPLGSAPVVKPRTRSKADLVTSAELPTLPATASASGELIVSGAGLPEALAREIINRRFVESGYRMQPDYRFSHGDTLVTLDGFDAERKVGFQYLSHGDQDVVTDHDVNTSRVLDQLARSGEAWILVIHDGEAPSREALVSIIDEFLKARA